MPSNDRSVQDLFAVQNLIKIDQILSISWYFVPHGTLGSERVKGFLKRKTFTQPSPLGR